MLPTPNASFVFSGTFSPGATAEAEADSGGAAEEGWSAEWEDMKRV